MSNRRYVKGVAAAAALSLSVLSAGCFGKFQLTRMIHDLNKTVEDKYVRSAVTWGFLIVPVYGFSAFLDFAVFNVVEFWTGENPMSVTKIRTEGADTASMTIAREGRGTVAVLDRYRDGRKRSTLVIRDDGAGVVRASLYEGGALAAESVARTLADGSVSVEGVAGGAPFVRRHFPSETVALRARVEGAVARVPGRRS